MVIEWLSMYGPPYLTHECSIGPIGTALKQYCLRVVAWINIALSSQTRKAVCKVIFIIT